MDVVQNLRRRLTMFVLGTLIALITAVGVTRTVSTVAKDGSRRVPTLEV